MLKFFVIVLFVYCTSFIMKNLNSCLYKKTNNSVYKKRCTKINIHKEKVKEISKKKKKNHVYSVINHKEKV